MLLKLKLKLIIIIIIIIIIIKAIPAYTESSVSQG